MIGVKVWIVVEVFVGFGVFVGEGVIVGVCGVVVKDVLGWEIWVGNFVCKIRDWMCF